MVKDCKSSVTDLLNEDTIDLAFLFIESIDKQDLMDGFIERTYSHWLGIVDEKPNDPTKMFAEVMATFEKLGKDREEEILRVVGDKRLKPELRERIWTIMRSLVKISIRYLHESRKKKDGTGKASDDHSWPSEDLDLDEHIRQFKLVA